MRTSARGLQLISRGEGKRLTAYRDAVGVWTIGRGHTGPDARPGNTITDERESVLFESDVLEAERTIERALPASIIAALPQSAWDALCSFVFNLGPKAFTNRNGTPTGLHRAILGRRWGDVPAQMRRWVHGRVDGRMVPLRGLVTRREEEASLWASAFAVTDQAECGVVPETPPEERPLMRTKTVAGAVVSVAAGAPALGEKITDAAQQAGAFAQPNTWLWSLVGIALAVGLILTIYGRLDVRRRTGA